MTQDNRGVAARAVTKKQQLKKQAIKARRYAPPSTPAPAEGKGKMVKLGKARGGCLGTKSRRKT